MAAALDDAAAIDEQDLVGMHQRTEAVGDDDRRAVLRDLAERGANALFGGGVDGGGGIVEHQDRRRRQKAAGDRQALALAAGKGDAAFTDQGLIAKRQADDVIVKLGRFGGAGDAVAIGPGIAIGDIPFDRGGEHEGVLLDDADGAAQRLQGDVPDILPVDGDAPAGDVVEAGNQMGDGRLAAARRTDDADRTAGTHLETDAGNDLPVTGLVLVGEAHIVESQHPVPDLKLRRIRFVADGGLEIEDLEQPCARRRGAGEAIDHHSGVAHRHLQDGHESQELRQFPNGDLAADDLEAADPQHQSHGAEVSVGHHRGVAHPDADALLGQGQGVVGDTAELVQFMDPGDKGTDDTYALEVLAHDRGEDRKPILQHSPTSPQLEAHDGGAPADEGYEAERQQSEDEIGAEQNIGADTDQQDQQDQAQKRRIDEFSHPFDVEHAAGDEIAGLHPVVEGKAEALQLLVIKQAKLVTQVLADGLAHVIVHHGEQPAHDARPQQRQRGDDKGGAGVVITAGETPLGMVHRGADELGHQQLEGGGGDGGADGDRHAPAITQGHARDAQQDRQVRFGPAAKGMDADLAVTAGLGPAGRGYAAGCSAGTHLTGISQLIPPIADNGSTFSSGSESDNDRAVISASRALVIGLAQRSETLSGGPSGSRCENYGHSAYADRPIAALKPCNFAATKRVCLRSRDQVLTSFFEPFFPFFSSRTCNAW